MDEDRTRFLEKMIEILDRLHETSGRRPVLLLASVIAIARGEAEDALRHAEELQSLIALRDKMTSATSWRPQPKAEAEERAEAGAEIAA